jgi:hypothetical protein
MKTASTVVTAIVVDPNTSTKSLAHTTWYTRPAAPDRKNTAPSSVIGFTA